jgi:predicted nucleic-acid-binding Zn-ribbon protein
MTELLPRSEPQKCAKCDASQFQKEELVTYGKLGVWGMGYLFNVYICRKCGYSEQYYVRKRWWV